MDSLNYYKAKQTYILDDKKNLFYSFSKSNRPEIISRNFGEWPSADEYEDIYSITFNVNSGDAKKITSSPDFLSKLTSLKYLGLPLDLFQLKPRRFLRALRV